KPSWSKNVPVLDAGFDTASRQRASRRRAVHLVPALRDKASGADERVLRAASDVGASDDSWPVEVLGASVGGVPCELDGGASAADVEDAAAVGHPSCALVSAEAGAEDEDVGFGGGGFESGDHVAVARLAGVACRRAHHA